MCSVAFLHGDATEIRNRFTWQATIFFLRINSKNNMISFWFVNVVISYCTSWNSSVSRVFMVGKIGLYLRRILIEGDEGGLGGVRVPLPPGHQPSNSCDQALSQQIHPFWQTHRSSWSLTSPASPPGWCWLLTVPPLWEDCSCTLPADLFLPCCWLLWLLYCVFTFTDIAQLWAGPLYRCTVLHSSGFGSFCHNKTQNNYFRICGTSLIH